MSTPTNAPRPSVMQLAIKEKGALYAAYIPFFVEGGIFVPTPRDYRLGDDVYVLLPLPADPQRYPVAAVQPPQQELMDRLMFAQANEAARCWQEGVLRSVAAARRRRGSGPPSPRC